MGNRRSSRTLIAFLMALSLMIGGGAVLAYQYFTASDAKSIEAVQNPYNEENWASAWKADGHKNRISASRANTVTPVALKAMDDNETRYLKEQFNRLIDTPFFHCYDNRNKTVTWQNLDDLRPCLNGTMHLRLEDGSLSVINTTDKNNAIRYVTVGTDTDRHLPTAGWDITVREEMVKYAVSELVEKTKPVYLIGHETGDSIYPFMEFVSVNGGVWENAGNLNDKSWEKTDTVDILLTWQDVNRSMNDAPLPSGFIWSAEMFH